LKRAAARKFTVILSFFFQTTTHWWAMTVLLVLGDQAEGLEVAAVADEVKRRARGTILTKNGVLIVTASKYV
jgi:hypothetical protein